MDLKGPEEDTGMEKTGGAEGSLRRGGIAGGAFTGVGWLEREEMVASLSMGLGLYSPGGDKVEARFKLGCVDA